MEAILYGDLLERREEGLAVTYDWIKTNATKIFRELNGDNPFLTVPKFSNKWVVGFLGRYELVRRKASTSRAKAVRVEEIMRDF